MLARSKWLFAVTAFVLMLPLARPAAADDLVGKFITARRAQFAGMPRLVVEVTSVANGRSVNLAVPNQDEKKAMFDPNPALLSIVKSLKPGDVVKATFAMQNNSAIVQTLVVYPLKPGEELPNAFVFGESYDKKEGKIDYQMIDAKRFDQAITFVIPNKKDASGELAPDPQMLADAGKFKSGDIVLIDAAPGRPHPTIKSIELYTAPVAGHFVKSEDHEVEAGQKTTAVELEADGKTITALVPGHLDGKKWVVDAKVLGEVKRLRPNSDVMFRLAEDNGKSWIRAIEMAPKQTAHGPPTASSSDPKPPADSTDTKPPSNTKPPQRVQQPKKAK